MQVGFDRVEGGNAPQRLRGDRRGLALCQIDEFPSHMASAECQRDAEIRRGQRLVGGVAVALKDAVVAGQQRLRRLGTAAWRVMEHHCRRVAPALGPVVARDRRGPAPRGRSRSYAMP